MTFAEIFHPENIINVPLSAFNIATTLAWQQENKPGTESFDVSVSLFRLISAFPSSHSELRRAGAQSEPSKPKFH